MNVLVLTPDAVGSTLIQRLLTIYMQFHDFDRPVINLHEITNGLEKYYSTDFNREIVSKRKVQAWTYYQSLPDIVHMLSSVDHYKVCRLAQYHIKSRRDAMEHQIPFYQYLDDNFFVIACRRRNVFEYGLSMSLNKITKRLNVFSHQEKINTFIDIYANQTQIDERVFLAQLENYRAYLDWSNDHFKIGSFFYYDDDIQNIERYILDLPVFDRFSDRITWQQKFDIDFNDWNRAHHAMSDIGRLGNSTLDSARLAWHGQDVLKHQDRVALYQKIVLPFWPAVQTEQDIDDLPDHVKQEFAVLARSLDPVAIKDPEVSRFLDATQQGYRNASDAIERMQQLDIIMTPPPIKKQTLSDKKRMIKNFDRCLEVYNQWADAHQDIAEPLTTEQLDLESCRENQFWRDFTRDPTLSAAPTTGRLGYQNGADL